MLALQLQCKLSKYLVGTFNNNNILLPHLSIPNTLAWMSFSPDILTA